MKLPLSACVLGIFASSIPTLAASPPTLDEIVDSFKLDQKTAGSSRSKWSMVEPGKPVGQTFKTGPKTIKLSRIAVWVAGWNEKWTKGESLVMTVYDSPDKNQKLGSFAMPYEWRMWETGVMMFPLGNIPVKPSSDYYFEFTVDGGDGVIEGIFLTDRDYAGGSLYEGGKQASGDLWFETHVKYPWDRDADYQYYFDQWNLDHPGLSEVKQAVASKDWNTAVKELVAYYESRTDLIQPVKPGQNPDYDRAYDDLVTQQKIKDSQGNIVELGPDWNHYITWPLRGGVGLTRTGIRKNLAGGYRNTGDEKFAIAWNDMILKTMRDQPSPLRAGAIPADADDIDAAPDAGINGGSMWSALSIGARMSNIWYFYQSMIYSPNFTTDARAAIIFNVVDMINVLDKMKGGGNWQTQLGDAMLEFGQLHPELKGSQKWFNEGFAILLENSRVTVHPDGALMEASINYHGLVTNRFLQLLENAKTNNWEIPTDFKRRVERMIEFIMFMRSPRGFVPATGDTFGPWGGEDLLRRGAEYFGRKDFLWAATNGKEGVVPAGRSTQFQYGGWFIMRSGWDRNALYANLRNGPNRGHGHHDSLQITLDAFGEELLIDPGVFVYGTSGAAAISRTNAHSTITVGGRDAHTDATSNHWESTSDFDHFFGVNAGYGGLENTKMSRRVIFVKPQEGRMGYFVVVDNIIGTQGSPIESRFVCPDGKLTINGNRAVFQNKDAGLLAVSPEGETIFSAGTGKRPASGDRLVDIPVIMRTSNQSPPLEWTQLLIPYKGSQTPTASVTKAAGSGNKTVIIVSLQNGKQVDRVEFDAQSNHVEVMHVKT